MGRRLFIVLIVAALVAVGTAYLSSLLLNNQPQPVQTATNQPVAPQQSSGTRILVAATDLPAGTLLQPVSLAWRSWPQDGIDRKLYIAEGEGRIEDYTGDVVRSGARAGDPIVRSNVIKRGESGFLAAVLAPGMRAVAITVNAEFGVAGFIFPGDRVDLIMAHDVQMPRADGIQGTIVHRVSETILQDVRVLAVDQRSSDQETIPAVSGTATLEVTPAQAEQVSLGSRIGELRLSLRSLAKNSESAVADAGATSSGQPDALALNGGAAGGPSGELTAGNASADSFAGSLIAPAENDAGASSENDKSKQTFTLDSDLSLLIAPPPGDDAGKSGNMFGNSSLTKVDVVRGSSMISVDTQNPQGTAVGNAPGMGGSGSGNGSGGAGNGVPGTGRAPSSMMGIP